MQRNRRDVFWAIATLGLMVVLALIRNVAERPPPLSVPSTYDGGPHGYRAFYELLRREAVGPERFSRHHQLLSAQVGTLILANAGDINPEDFSRNDLAALVRWVKLGGRLIVLDTNFGGPEDAKLGLPANRRSKRTERAEPFATLFVGVKRVQGNFASDFPYNAAPKALPLLVNEHGIVALQYALGKGTVVAITDPQMFDNLHISRADNAQLGYQLAAAGGRVFFDEAIHGYLEGSSFWAVLPRSVHIAVYLALLIILLAVIGDALRWVPPLVLVKEDTPPSAAHLEAVARLLLQARAGKKALLDFATPVVARASGRTLRPQLGVQLRELRLLLSVEHPSDSQMLRAGRLCAHLRKELG